MALHISNPKANKLARKLAKQTGKTITETVIGALEDSLANRRRQDDRERRYRKIMEIVDEMAKLPVLDDRPADEIIGYNKHGHFD